MSTSLPERPHLSHLKAQAKDLLDSFRAGNTDAIARVTPYFDSPTDFGLSEAQLVLAREYGFESWGKLKDHVLLRTGDLDRQERADQLAARAMWGDVATIRQFLQEEPDLATATLSAACATGSVETVRTLLAASPELINQKIGDKEWEPLLHVCFSCLLKDEEYRPGLLATARYLLDSGANPNANWLNAQWDDCPEACLYGATGVNDCPELAELLLKAGADPNDGESLYHSMELATPDCMKVIMDHGGKVDRVNALAHLLDWEKPDWIRLMLSYAKDPAEIPPVLPHALRRGRSTECFQILIGSGMDLNTRNENNLSPYQSALRLGRSDVTALLAEAGADTTRTLTDEIIGRLARGEQVLPQEIPADVIKQLDSEPQPELILQAERGNNTALETLLAAGANPNVRDKQNVPLHIPAMLGRLDTIRLLLRYGADPTIRDTVHDGHAVGWACAGSNSLHDPAAEPIYVQVIETLLDAGGVVPEKAWGSPAVQALLVQRGAKPA